MSPLPDGPIVDRTKQQRPDGTGPRGAGNGPLAGASHHGSPRDVRSRATTCDKSQGLVTDRLKDPAPGKPVALIPMPRIDKSMNSDTLTVAPMLLITPVSGLRQR